MAKFKVDYPTVKSPTEAYEKIKSYLGQDAEIKKLDAKAACTFNDANRSCQIQGSQFKADVVIQDQQGGSLVQINVDLPFLLMPFKSKVEEMLKKNLAKHPS